MCSKRFQNQSVCATCDTVGNDQNFALINDSDCDRVKSVPSPKQELGASGRTYECCGNAPVCTEDRTHQQFRDNLERRKRTGQFCIGANGLLFFCKSSDVKCQLSSDCPTGGYGTTALRTALGESCVSAASIPSVPATSQTIFGFREIPKGINLNNDK